MSELEFDINEDFWYYVMGLHPIICYTKHKQQVGKPISPISYTEYKFQGKIYNLRDEMPEEVFQHLKKTGGYQRHGIGVAGGLIHRGKNKGKYLIMIDSDNKSGTDSLFPEGLEEAKKKHMIEQHLDNPDKLHLYVIADRPIRNIGSSRTENKIEVKSTSDNGVHFVSPSVHKDGERYEIVGKTEPSYIKDIDEFENKLLEIAGINKLEIPKTMKQVREELPKKGKESNRQRSLLQLCRSFCFKNKGLIGIQDVINFAKERNNELAEPYSEDVAIKKAESAWEYHLKDDTEDKETLNFNKVAKQIQSQKDFITLENSDQIYTFDGKRYSEDEAITYIEREVDKIFPTSGQNFAREVIKKIKVRTKKKVELFNNYNELNIENGLLDLKTLELSEHSPNKYATLLCPIEYHKPEFEIRDETIFDDIEKNLKDTLFWKFLTRSFTINKELEKESFQSALEMFASVFVKALIDDKGFMNLGGGENGKSVLLEYIQSMVGDENASNLSLDQIANSPFDRAILKDKLVNIFADLESNELKKTGTLKNILTGDPIEAQFKYGNPFKVRVFGKLIFSCNRFPRVNDPAHGFFRRWIIIKWNRNFEGDKERDGHLKEKLQNQDEKNKVFSCLIHLSSKLIRDRKFAHTKDAKQIQKEWNEYSDPILNFVEQFTEHSQSNTSKFEMLNHYRAFCNQVGETPLTGAQFRNAFSNFFEESKSDGVRVWCNVIPKHQAELPKEEN